MDFVFIGLLLTESICKVGDCGLQTYQTVEKLKRATTVEFTTITPILYIHCYASFLFFYYLLFVNLIRSFKLQKVNPVS